jgi:hypothetical protein
VALFSVGVMAAASVACRPGDGSVPAAPLASGVETTRTPVVNPVGWTDGGIADTYAFDVRVVDRPPSPVFLLAHFSEPPGDACLARLTAHARGLGANVLFVDRDSPCAGGAFFVRGIQHSTAQDDAGPSPAGSHPEAADASIGSWLRARWKRPPSISADESRHLCAVVQFTVSPMRRVWNVRGQPIRSSGNSEFDESVRAALESAIDEHATVPAPPHDLVGEHVDYRVEFTEGDPHICRQPTP